MQIKVKAALACAVLAASLAGVGASSASAASIGYNIVVAQDLYVRHTPEDGLFIGTLNKGEHFNVQQLWFGWAWGFAYGNANKCGWVLTGSASNPYLVTSTDPHGTPPDCGAPRHS
jgi:hypothetical protein